MKCNFKNKNLFEGGCDVSELKGLDDGIMLTTALR